ncbi:hypothetical protein [Cellulomonas xiejunii]|uniref:Uncharacterized protein n=1 Tax=Cellulomonas xiejunii TaxID=2968083 RepID=A0ABY5KQ81_9CELL|nr:hypothetical protein [Cellulomonas xiejunii]MCC2322616.1 hypothetical protein [Cellulomonas xiejunii]UUI72649.1 hypothetical protein NP048_04100 [Cellulomonas xiejunii]
MKVRYADYWDGAIAADEVTWITEAEARRSYEEGKAFSAVGSSVARKESPLQRWTFTVGASGDVRVAFFDRHGTRRRTIDYRSVDGKLWRHAMIDLEYPDAERSYHRSRAVRRREARFEPDGHVRVEITDRTQEPTTKDVFTSDDLVVASFWMARPAFGRWEDLTDPEFGAAPAA